MRFIPESLVINDYLEEIYPQISLQSNDSYIKAKQRVLIERFYSVNIQKYCVLQNFLYFKITSPFYKIFRTNGKEGCDDLNKNLQTYEEALTDQYFNGSKPGLTDFTFWPWFERLSLLSEVGFQFNVDKQFSKLATWITCMEADENVRKVKVPVELTKRFMNSYRQGKPQYDFE